MNNQVLTSPPPSPEEPVVIRPTEMDRVIKTIANMIAEFKDVSWFIGSDVEDDLVKRVNFAIERYKVGGDNVNSL